MQRILILLMPIYNLSEYSNNYSMTSGSLRNYYKDEINGDKNENDDNGKKINNKTTASKSFKYKTKIKRSTTDNARRLNAEVVVPLKYLSNFWRSLDLPLINCEIELDLRWERNCIITEASRTFRAVDPNAGPVVYELVTEITGATFQINNVKLYIPVVTLSINDNIKFLKNIKQGFKRIISWNRYRSEITTQPKNNNLDYLADPTFRDINRLFVLSFKNGNTDPMRDSFDKYYMPLVEIKDFNALIDNKPFLDHPAKNKQEACEKLIEVSKNDDYTTRNILDYLYHQNYYELIGIDLSRKANASIPQQINFVGKLEENHGA